MKRRNDDRALLTMNFPIEVQVNGQSVSIQRDLIIDADDMDGSWSFNVYQAGHDEGGSIRVTDSLMTLFFDALFELFLDPDGFGQLEHPDSA